MNTDGLIGFLKNWIEDVPVKKSFYLVAIAFLELKAKFIHSNQIASNLFAELQKHLRLFLHQ